MDVGRVGVWCNGWLQVSRAERQEAAAELDGLGWGTLWLPESDGAFVLAKELLRVTRRVKVATGGLNIRRYAAGQIARRHASVQYSFGPRMLLGLAVAQPMATAALDQESGVVAEMAAYLDALDAAPVSVPSHERLLADANQRTVGLACRRTLGVCSTHATPEATLRLRERLGDRPLIAVLQSVGPADGPPGLAMARSPLVRRAAKFGPALESVQAHDYEQGDDADAIGSDRFTDTVRCDNLEAIAGRVRAHIEAGADHVALDLIATPDGLPMGLLRSLSPLVGTEPQGVPG